MSFDAELAADLIAQGKTWTAVAEECGTSVVTVRAHFDPQYRERRREQLRFNNGSGHCAGDLLRGMMTIAAKADAQRLLAQIPADTRNLTQRLSGDPLPGRSALDRREAR